MAIVLAGGGRRTWLPAPSSSAAWRSGSRSSSCPTTGGSTNGRRRPSAGRPCSWPSWSPWCVASQLQAVPSPSFAAARNPSAWCSAASVIFTVGMVDDLREMSAAGQDVRPGPGRDRAVPLRASPCCSSGCRFAGTTVVLSADLVPAAHRALGGRHGQRREPRSTASTGWRPASWPSPRAPSFCTPISCFRAGNIASDNSGPLVAVICLGLCLGFLPHNFHPARIFMGDAGAMLLGLLMAASTMSVVGQTDQPLQRPHLLLLRPDVHPVLHPRHPDARHRLRHRAPGRPPRQPGRGRQGPPPPPPDAPRSRSDPRRCSSSGPGRRCCRPWCSTPPTPRRATP